MRGRMLPIAAASLEGQAPMRILTQGTVTPEELRMQRHNQQTLVEMQQAKILRAVYSERQLQEVMVDFWTNHFNVYAQKGADRWLLPAYDRDTIRPHTMGKFSDLLIATAQEVEFRRDGQPLLRMIDPAPYTDGWFALRTTWSHLRIANLRIRRVNER